MFLEKVKKVLGAYNSNEGAGKYNYVFKLDGVDQKFYQKPFGHQIDTLRKIKEFTEKAKSEHVSAKGTATLTAVKNWVKENKPSQYYAKWEKDSSHYKEDSVEIFYID